MKFNINYDSSDDDEAERRMHIKNKQSLSSSSSSSIRRVTAAGYLNNAFEPSIEGKDDDDDKEEEEEEAAGSINICNLMTYQQDNVEPSIKLRNYHNDNLSFHDSAHAGLGLTYEQKADSAHAGLGVTCEHEAIVVKNGSTTVFKNGEDDNNNDDKPIPFTPSNSTIPLYKINDRIMFLYKKTFHTGKITSVIVEKRYMVNSMVEEKRYMVKHDSYGDCVLNEDDIFKDEPRFRKNISYSEMDEVEDIEMDEADEIVDDKNATIEEYFAFQDIRDRRVVDGRIELLVKWSHYPESDNSWVHDEVLIEDGLGDDIDEWYSLGIKQEVTSTEDSNGDDEEKASSNNDDDDDDDEDEVPFEVGDDLFM